MDLIAKSTSLTPPVCGPLFEFEFNSFTPVYGALAYLLEFHSTTLTAAVAHKRYEQVLRSAQIRRFLFAGPYCLSYQVYVVP